MENFSVHGAPSEYILAKGALDFLEEKLLERGLRKVLVVHGEKSWEATKPFWPKFNVVVYDEYVYGGECSQEEIRGLAAALYNCDGVVGVGGGKVLDLVKAVSFSTRVPVVLIPTLASNCSPWTPISVIYDDYGAFIRYEVYPVSTSLVLVEPRILIGAPLEIFIAGIGDTLAKWYEADVQLANISNKPVPLQISHYTARQCKDLILRHSVKAIHSVKTGELNEDFIKVVETIIVLGGMVGGFGSQYGRIAGAHAIHNGITSLEESHYALHGYKVAYGILVQLVLENKWTEIEALLPFYELLGLPRSMMEIGVKELTEQKINSVAIKSTVPVESIHLMPIGTITAERVADAITRLEKFVVNNKS